jgi:plasmid stabilization system protein ParE
VTIRILPEAQQEVDDAFEYYEAHRAGLGERFISAVEHGYDLIEAHPKAWPRARRNARSCKLNKFPFAIIYLPRRREIVVIAVSHLSRRRGYWMYRLGRGV